MRKPLICPHCDRPTGRRAKGAPKLPKCPRCPGQPTVARIVEPLRDLRVAFVDAGATSGIAVSHRGEVEIVDSIDVWSRDPDVLCSDLVAAGVALIVIEKSAGAFAKSGGSPEGAIAIWKRAWLLAGGARSRIVRLHTSTWRSVALARSKELAREEWKAIAVREASNRFGATARRWMREGEVVEPRPGSVAWDDNTADAALGLWAALRLPEVHEKIPPTVLRKAASA